jgi:hypothetical protein
MTASRRSPRAFCTLSAVLVSVVLVWAVPAWAGPGTAATPTTLVKRPDRVTTPPDASAQAAPVAPDQADPELEAAVGRLQHSIASAPPSPALGRGFEGLDMALVARTAQGHVRALSAPPGAAFPLPRGLTGGAGAEAVGFLARHALAFGVARPGVRLVAEQEKAARERRVVRLRQEFQAIPVFAAAALVQLGPGGVEFVLADLARDNADFHSPEFDVSPSTSPGAAGSVALSLASEAQPAPDLVVDEPELMIFEPSVIGEAGPSQLVWRTRVRSTTADVDELVLVDARTGEVAFHFSQIKNAKNREIWDCNSTASCTINRTEGQGASAITDVNQAYDYLGDTYNFFYTRFGRDSLDAAGLKLIGKVRYCPSTSSCPWQNASWNGVEMKFGAGFTAADDVVAHELTHGVTEHESNLIYWNEAGAINESLSDIFGEFVDQTNSGGTDTPAVRWKLGEDVPVYGAARDMADPTYFGDPDRRNSTYWFLGPGDNHGVHINSGVGNKLAYLLTDGATFNGYTVAGQGLTKTAQLFYEAEANLLVTGSDYIDLYYALRRAAINLGWSPDARATLERACRAVEIDMPMSVTTIMTDDFEKNMAKWTVVDYSSTGTTWGRSSYRKSGGSYSAWCAGGGSNPVSAGGNYKKNMNTWMKYGPFSLSGASRAWFEYDLRLYSPGADPLAVYVSVNGTNWYGYTLYDSSVGWTTSGFVHELNDMRDLERVFSSYGLTIVGQPQVWVAFKFSSNSDDYVYEGNYIDNFALYKSGGSPPFGSFDTPVNNSTGVTGSIAVTGWALDDDEVTKVELWRNSVSPEPAGQIYIGDANFVPGARPDVDGAYSTYPWSYRAGWGYMLLTNFLPSSGNGTFVLNAYAKDAGGGSTLLASRTITCTNATAVKPFGAIDTPGQGETVSGTIVNFGWALTPMPAAIPTDGSTIWVYIDGTPVGHPVYNQYRSDIATLFPGYANSNGAVGYYYIDTTALANGIHTIEWVATDNQGRADGIGSRYFWVAN